MRNPKVVHYIGRLRRLAVACAAFAALGTATSCDVLRPADQFDGQWGLASINGTNLPVTVLANAAGAVFVVDGTMTLNASAKTWEYAEVRRGAINGQILTNTILSGGTFESSGSDANFRDSNGTVYPVSVAAATLTLRGSAAVYRFVKRR